MRDQVEQRLAELRSEYQAGQKMLADLEAKQDELRQTLLRISGAVQVLEELLQPEQMAGVAEGNGRVPST